MSNEELIESKMLFEGRIVRLRLDTVRLPNGTQTTREVIVHQGAIAAVPLLETGEVVMVRQYRQAAGELLLEIPAGTLDPSESPEDCARRELVEEIGYHPHRLTRMMKSYLAPGYSSEMLHTYLAEELEYVGSNPEEDEFLEVVKIPLLKALAMIGSGEIHDAKTICGLLMAHNLLSVRPSQVRTG